MIKQDLRINAGARHILDAFGAEAYAAYQASRDLEAVVKQFETNLKINSKMDTKTTAKAGKKVFLGNSLKNFYYYEQYLGQG